MKFFYTACCILFSTFAFSQPQAELTAKNIIDSSLTFCGGEARLAKTISSDLSYSLTQPDGSTAVINEKIKAGKKYVQCILSKNYIPQTTFFDGEKVSRVNGDAILHVTDLSAIEEIKLKTYNQLQYGYKALGYELTRLPDQQFKNFDCYVVNAKAANGYATINFFDKTNFRLLMVAYPNGNKSLMIEYIFKDSVLFNSHILNTFAHSKDQQIVRLLHVKLNIGISDLWFNCPYSDKIAIPKQLVTGKFESTNGVKTTFERTADAQDYPAEQGEAGKRRLLNWTGSDTYHLIDEKAIKDNAVLPESEILVRIISWNDNEYVCQWIAGKYSDTQDYKLIK